MYFWLFKRCALVLAQELNFEFPQAGKAAGGEVGVKGEITRQCLYLADQPYAVVNTPGGKPLSKKKLLAPESIGLDARNTIKLSSWFKLTIALTSQQNTFV